MPLGRRVLGAALSSLTREALQGPGRRMPSQAQSCFHAKENTFEVGFRLRTPPAKQQGPGSQGQPRPAVPSGEQRARGENGLRCFPEPRRVGVVVAASPCLCAETQHKLFTPPALRSP